MANLQIKGIDDALYTRIKQIAASENRSISQQILFLVKSHLKERRNDQTTKTSAQTLLELSGSWHDKRESDEIIESIRAARKNAKKRNI